MKSFPQIESNLQTLISNQNMTLSILREDLIHPTISGNKFRKLKYNLIEFKTGNYNKLLTFGGAYSNHIAAVAAAGREFGIETIGVIRGEELASKYLENPTLRLAEENGMKFKFIDRNQYRNKSTFQFTEQLKSEFGNLYILPEGGTNSLAIKGCEEILGEQTKVYDYICVPIGTAGTVSGIIKSCQANQKILGFPSLKDANFLLDEIKSWTNRSNWELITDYHFGGYGKINPQLIDFINDFKEEYNVPLDPVYTGKMMFGLMDLILNNYFPPQSKVLAIHTGGLQGIEGFNQSRIKQNKTQIR